MTIHKEGFKIILFTFLGLGLINLILVLVAPPTACFIKWSGPVSLVLLFLVVNFFRSPKREGYLHDNAILSPADGEIVVIEETEETEILQGKCIQVSVFMSVFNVHINWYPIDGVINYCKHHVGRFLSAYLPKASTENERTTVSITHENGDTIVVRQIAGALARRIVCYAKDEEKAVQGQQMGFIKFGSRVDLFLPLGTRIDVKVGQKVRGKQTIIGWLE